MGTMRKDCGNSTEIPREQCDCGNSANNVEGLREQCGRTAGTMRKDCGNSAEILSYIAHALWF